MFGRLVSRPRERLTSNCGKWIQCVLCALFALETIEKPGAGGAPIARDSIFGNAENFGDLGILETAEVAEFHDAGFSFIDLGEFGQRFVQVDKAVKIGIGSHS